MNAKPPLVDPPTGAAPTEEPGRATPRQTGAARILVIEDDALVRFNMVSYLEDCGHIAAEVEDGEAGIAAVAASPPDLVLCDLRMPGMDGLEVLQRLHAEHPELPVVVVSGTGVLSDAVEALRMGAWDFVTKPIQDLAVLQHAIDRALEKARLQRENSRIQCELQRANRQMRQHLDQLQQDADAGRNLQLQLMPPRERLMGAYRFNRFLLPSLYLSGDFVDYFLIDAGHIGFYLADVSGHGVPSALVTVLVKSLVDHQLELHQNEGEHLILDPAGLLTRLSADLLAQRLDKYLTIFYGVIDTDQNRLTFSNGGHFPAPLMVDDRGTRIIEQRGYPVGMFDYASYENASLSFSAQQRLMLFSDGVLDALPGPRLRDKRARLQATASRLDLDAAGVLASLGLDQDGAFPDDITLLIAERLV
jgi:serine phosphatase RsbU (regulator of sigma subunit)